VQRQIQNIYTIFCKHNGKNLLDCKNDDSNKDYIVCHNEPIILSGRVIDQRIKGTLGITGLCFLRVFIDESVWHLDVD